MRVYTRTTFVQDFNIILPVPGFAVHLVELEHNNLLITIIQSKDQVTKR